METRNYIEVKGNIGSISPGKHRHKNMFFVNSYINKRDMNLIFYSDAELPEGIKNGDKVRVKGYVAVIPVFSAVRNIYVPKQLFIAEEVSLCVPHMTKEFGQGGSYFGSDSFFAAFSGVITEISDAGDARWKKISMITNSKDSSSSTTIVMDYYIPGNRYSKLPEFDFHVGDKIQAICSITTSAKEINGERRFFQDFKIEDIQKCQ